MRLEDAPEPGWYPDEERRGRLRWWNGADWTSQRRAEPSAAELELSRIFIPEQPGPPRQERERPPPGSRGLPETDELITQVRQATREEVTRAADVFSQRARVAVRQARDVVGGYAAQVLRWIKIATVVVALLVIAWFVFQFIVQATFLEWLGDRIDNVSD